MPNGLSRIVLPPGVEQLRQEASRPIYSPLERIAAVALRANVGAQSVYSYRVPERLTSLRAGQLVQVPFGPRSLQGVVLSTALADPGAMKLRDVGELLDPEPCLTAPLLDLAHWAASYYACGLGDMLDAMLPAGLDRATVTTYSISDSNNVPSRLTADQREVLCALREHGPMTAARLAGGGDVAHCAKLLDGLTRRGLARRQVTLGEPEVKERTETLVVLQPGYRREQITQRQQAIVAYLSERGGEASIGELRAELKVDRAIVRRMVDRRVLLSYERQVRRDPLAHRNIEPNPEPNLMDDQRSALERIRASLDAEDGAAFLLHGITGSGKTEVYLQAARETLDSGRQALILVPEIGLTPQAVVRFAGRFPGQVALLHSRLSAGERYDEWQRIRSGECSVVVGPRSAIFSPVPRLGLVVIDEEHDQSYKQDQAPRYHTRDLALRLAQTTGATVVMGSATPDIVTYHQALAGEFTLLTMANRVRTPDRILPEHGVAVTAHVKGRGLPAVRVVDMRLELKAGNRSIFSRVLAGELEATLGRGEQAILFLNRRGSATFVNCRDCGYVVKCRHCDIPMTYHSQGMRLLCHRCDARMDAPTLCDRCGSWRIRYFGLGTQKVEAEVLSRFPGVTVQRYDRDVTAGRQGHETILDKFARGEIDVLVGTQIVAKGLDFPRVTLVGAVSADTSLNAPDFRAAERTFSLLTQVAGRAGRADLPGFVIVQTYAPSHYAVIAASRHDYLSFYRDEIRMRADGAYPPFTRLVRLIRSERTENSCMEAARELGEHLASWLEAHSEVAIELIGPAPCFVRKSRDRYYWQIVLRGADLHPILGEVPRGWAIDVDPLNLL